MWKQLIQENQSIYERLGYLDVIIHEDLSFERKKLKRGRPKEPKKKEHRITIRLEEDLYRLLKEYCQTKNISKSKASGIDSDLKMERLRGEKKRCLKDSMSLNRFEILNKLEHERVSITPVLPLRVMDVKYTEHLRVKEKKMKNVRKVKMTAALKQEIEQCTRGKADSDYLFPSRKGNKPIGRETAWRIYE